MSPVESPDRIRVLMHKTQTVEEMGLDEYLQGVVRAEIGPNYPLEALKAQAIAARSFALATLAARKHGDLAHVCTDSTCCQAWQADHAPLPDQAVTETRGQVITFGDAIAAAFYFGHCDGHTRSFEDVWAAVSPVPYCRGVPCICGYTERWGHGVGMCQEGARAMAAQGATAEEILRHYYTGIAVTISDPWGNRWAATSGDKPEHGVAAAGVGGFEVLLWFDTTYTVQFLDQEFRVVLDGAFTFLTFTEAAAPAPKEARLVSRWLSADEARTWRDRLEAQAATQGLFEVEER